MIMISSNVIILDNNKDNTNIIILLGNNKDKIMQQYWIAIKTMIIHQ